MGAARLVAIERLKLSLRDAIAVSHAQDAAPCRQKAHQHSLLATRQHHIANLRLPPQLKALSSRLSVKLCTLRLGLA
eukprot:7391958-Prymnesium_polylepis.3